MNAALLLVTVAGSMTSTAALQQVSGVARSTTPLLVARAAAGSSIPRA
jgi:hypothetical protein